MIIRDDTTAFKVLAEIVDNFEKTQVGLTLDEIRESVGLAHRSTVHHHISRLTENGFLEKIPGRAKSVRPTSKGEQMVLVMRS